MSRRPPSGGMWLPPPGSLSQSTSTFNIQDDPRAGGEATRMAHQLEESFWRNLEQLERQLLQRDQPPAINWRPIARREFEWTEVFAHFVAPSASTQRAALLGQAVQQASRYVARLLLAWIPHVNDISETRRRAMVEAMTSLMDAHVSAGYREQASALHGSGGNMDYGHAQAAVAYTKGLRIINPAFQQLQNSDPYGNMQRVQPTFYPANRPSDHPNPYSFPPVSFTHGYSQIGASTAPPPGQYSSQRNPRTFSLPPGYYQSLARIGDMLKIGRPSIPRSRGRARAGQRLYKILQIREHLRQLQTSVSKDGRVEDGSKAF